MQVAYYQTARGDLPVRSYIDALPEVERAKVMALIDYLSEAVVLREPHAKKINGYPGLFELRPGPHRVFYCYHGDTIVLLHAFRKKSDKTPIRELETASARMRS
ncbi:MAG TPA: type II toxin-antitoxin system RelE/ParE family toxin [bacterium]|nr:type II toxin-antitoxin system RelE/ParE family toxin [bacterium]